LDSAGNVYLTGDSSAPGFAGVAAATTATLGPASGNVLWVEKLSNDATQRIYTTFLGGSVGEFGVSAVTGAGHGIAVDAAGSAYIAATPLSPASPTKTPIVTEGRPPTTATSSTPPPPAVPPPPQDMVISKLSPDGKSLVYSSYVGTTNDGQSMTNP